MQITKPATTRFSKFPRLQPKLRKSQRSLYTKHTAHIHEPIQAQALACAVIETAIGDYLRQPSDLYLYRFLTGEAFMGKFWLQAAGMEPLTHQHMESIRARAAYLEPFIGRGGIGK